MLKVIISGKKSSGKSSFGKLIFAEFINKQIGKQRFSVVKRGKEAFLLDSFQNKFINTDSPNENYQKLVDCYKIKMYSFADPLKRIAMDIFGLYENQVYGSDDDKNTKTHVSWDSIYDEVRNRFCRPKRGTGQNKPPSGQLTSRELLEILGTDVFRRFDQSCWARALLNQIEKEDNKVSIVTDGRFPNEISMASEIGAKTVRLLRNPYDSKSAPEVALDGFPLGEFSHVYDNNDISMTQFHQKAKKDIHKWFDHVGL